MGIVKISEELHTAAKNMAKAMDRSINAQAEHWMKIGRLIEANPTMTYQEVRAFLLKQAQAEKASCHVEDN
jgi:hypothetical protein